MSGFRGSDGALDREIAALERVARVRVRRAATELREIERSLRELRRERTRRQALDEESARIVESGEESAGG
jgi:hypothetical protein